MSTQQTQALQRIEQPQSMALDAVGRRAAIDDLLNKVALVQEVMKKVMHEGEHFGIIPGCGTKPALMKAGAEKLGMTFRLQPSFTVSERDLGNAHREYSIVCTLSDGTQGVGSCSTMESKYRYRQGERKCPECGKATIITGKKEYGGGFICFQKKGGCGAKFGDSDERITGQQIGKVEHDNPADYWNTCLKMGKKRAHVDAIITATACSDIFTQDLDELATQMVTTDAAPATKAATAPATPEQPTQDGPHTEVNVEVLMVSERTGESKGKPWKAHLVKMTDGTNDLEAGTFSATLGKLAEELSTTGQRATATIKPGKAKGRYELVSLVPIPADKAKDDLPFEDDVPIGNTP